MSIRNGVFSWKSERQSFPVIVLMVVGYADPSKFFDKIPSDNFFFESTFYNVLDRARFKNLGRVKVRYVRFELDFATFAFFNNNFVI